MGRSRISKKPIYDLMGNCIGYEAPEKDVKIVMCEKSEADRVIVPHHYSHKVTKNSFCSLLVWWHGKINGALQCGYGIRPKIKGEYNSDEVREFDRMWLSDEMPKFSETIVLSLFHHFMRLAYPSVKVLISYADTSAGNKGTIYKAANYQLIDRLKADFYIIPKAEGGFERLHPVTAWHRHGTRAWDFMQRQYPGIRKAVGEQLKFIYKL